jgi:sRNA-binding carbon storage regulator CsrA
VLIHTRKEGESVAIGVEVTRVEGTSVRLWIEAAYARV